MYRNCFKKDENHNIKIPREFFRLPEIFLYLSFDPFTSVLSALFALSYVAEVLIICSSNRDCNRRSTKLKAYT